MITIVAPGKLMIAGEYAVLNGAPAIVLAVDCGVRCDIAVSDHLQIETPNGDERFVRPPLEGHIGHYRFSAHNPTDLPDKPGFGGSAAACVAACLAAGLASTEAIGFHKAIQGGGSGVDVLASINGGMIRAQHGKATPLSPILPTVIWAGISAKTQPRIDHYLAQKTDLGFIAASTEIVDGFCEDPIHMLQENAQLLKHMAQKIGLPYMTPTLAAIAKLAREHGGAAKASGAGGGDCAIALFNDPEAESAFQTAAIERGLTLIPVSMAGPAALLG